MEHDTLARMLSAINSTEARGSTELEVKPASRLIKQVLELLKKEDYIESYESSGEKKDVIKIKLNGTINRIGAIKPRYPVMLGDYEKFESRYLPAKDFGRLLVSTSKGVMTHIDAKTKKLGGVLLAYVY